ncbi:MAG: hypothetical protein KAS71_12185, partial [Bacteroidales bacterium]|nr:hypothetical protein [Bacteroidales bacterium]
MKVKLVILLLVVSTHSFCQKNYYSFDNLQTEMAGYSVVKGKIENLEKFKDQYSTIEITIADWTTSLRLLWCRYLFTGIHLPQKIRDCFTSCV